MRIAIASVGTTGDVRPFAALAAALVAGGHQVTVISWDLHRSVFDGTGAHFEAAGPATSEEQIRETAGRAARARSPMQQVAILRDFHLREGAAHYRQLRTLLPDHDLAVIHGVHSLAQAAATDAGVPFATAVFDPVLLPTGSAPPAGMPNLGPFNSLGWRLLDRMLRPLEAPLRDVLAEAGSSSRPALFRGRSPLLHLVACSPAIMRVPGDLPPSTHVTGYWQTAAPPTPLPADLDRFLHAGTPPVVITFGSMSGTDTRPLLGAAVAAARGLGLRAVVQHWSDDGTPAAGGESMRIGSVDHRLLFPLASVVVHHGGAGTTYAAVAAGVPSVVVPHVGDQRYWAERLHALGVAPAPLPLASADERRLTDRLDAARRPELVEAVRALGTRVQGERGVDVSVKLIDELATHF